MDKSNRTMTVLLAAILGVFIIIAVLLGVILGVLLGRDDDHKLSSDKTSQTNEQVQRPQPTAPAATATMTEAATVEATAPVQTEAATERVDDQDRIVGTWYASMSSSGDLYTAKSTEYKLEFRNDSTFTLDARFVSPSNGLCPGTDVTFTTVGNYQISGSDITLHYVTTSPLTYDLCGTIFDTEYGIGQIHLFTLINENAIQSDYPASGGGLITYTR